MRQRIRQLGTLCAALVLTSCGLEMPADPEDTLERVRGGTLRVGVSPHPPHTVVVPDGPPSGSDVDLAAGFAASIGARPVWVAGGEEPLITALEHGQLELVIGGLTADTPWTEKAAITKPYAKARDSTGKEVELVMAAPMGENAFLMTLERFLVSQGAP
jgi:polar amino acid transport system substrate-binding protein